MIKTSFIIPKADNNGVKYPRKLIREIESDIIKIAGGLTKTDIVGFWQNDKKLFIDRNNYYFTIIVSIPLLV